MTPLQGDTGHGQAEREDATEEADAVLQDHSSLERGDLCVDLRESNLVGFSPLEHLMDQQENNTPSS